MPDHAHAMDELFTRGRQVVGDLPGIGRVRYIQDGEPEVAIGHECGISANDDLARDAAQRVNTNARGVKGFEIS